MDAATARGRRFATVAARILWIFFAAAPALARADATIPPTTAAPDCATAKADLLRAEADLVAANHDFERMKQLVANCGPERDLERAQEVVRDARAELDRARARLKVCSRSRKR
jgi:multidrug resistance efflux pump